MGDARKVRAMGMKVAATRTMLAAVEGGMFRWITFPTRIQGFSCRQSARILAVLVWGAVTLAPIFTATCRGEFIIGLQQVGGNVVANGSGTINLAALINDGPNGGDPLLIPDEGTIGIGAPETDGYNRTVWYVAVGPSYFGPGSLSFPTTSSGDPVSIGDGSGLIPYLYLPIGYVSGAPLSATATWDGTTFDGLGLTSGTYTWTWGSGATADSFVIEIPAASVPEPPSFVILAVLSLGAVCLTHFWRCGTVCTAGVCAR